MQIYNKKMQQTDNCTVITKDGIITENIANITRTAKAITKALDGVLWNKNLNETQKREYFIAL